MAVKTAAKRYTHHDGQSWRPVLTGRVTGTYTSGLMEMALLPLHQLQW